LFRAGWSPRQVASTKVRKSVRYEL
jgi:hypothetical protein